MKRTLLATCMAFLMVTAYAQNSYIVKTSGVLEGTRLETLNQEEETAIDFISQNFKFQSLCDWQEGMKFMVIPSEYDMVVKTFTDAATEKDVSSVKLRHKIMIYMGHEEDKDGHERINFRCQEDQRKYYYEIPSDTFEDYWYPRWPIWGMWISPVRNWWARRSIPRPSSIAWTLNWMAMAISTWWLIRTCP